MNTNGSNDLKQDGSNINAAESTAVDSVVYEQSTIEKLARKFASNLRMTLSGEEMNAINELNATESDQKICHSQSFCDANMVMLDALDECGLPADVGAFREAECKLWGDAWKLAIQSKFYPPVGGDVAVSISMPEMTRAEGLYLNLLKEGLAKVEPFNTQYAKFFMRRPVIDFAKIEDGLNRVFAEGLPEFSAPVLVRRSLVAMFLNTSARPNN